MKSKKLGILLMAIAGTCALLLAIIIIMCSTSDRQIRQSLKDECGAGMDCDCFSNVIDYRLTSDQIRVFHKFLKSLKKRPTTNILEFIDEASARTIFEVVNICRPAPVQQEPNQRNKR